MKTKRVLPEAALAIIVAAATSGCASYDSDYPKSLGDIPIGVDNCVMRGTPPFRWQRCLVEITRDDSSKLVMPSKLLYVSRPYPAVIVWKLPEGANFPDHALKIGTTGGGLFTGDGPAADDEGLADGTPGSRYYRVLLTQFGSVCREYTLEASDGGGSRTAIDPTIANGNTLLRYDASRKLNPYYCQ